MKFPLKNLINSLFFCLSFGTFAQNVGINNTSPLTTLDVQGGVRYKPLYLTASGSNITIPAHESNINISGTFTAKFSATTISTVDGQRLTIDNNSSHKGVLDNTIDIKMGLNEYVYSDGEWKAVNANAWELTGNEGTVPGTNFIGTIDKNDLVFKTYNNESMRLFQQGGLEIGTTIQSTF